MSSNILNDPTASGIQEVFVRDRLAGTTQMLTTSDNTTDYPTISANGRYVGFESFANMAAGDTNNTRDVFVYDRQTGQTEMVSLNSDGVQANSQSERAHPNADGRYVAFASSATNLFDGLDTPDTSDIFVRDRNTGQTVLVSVTSAGVKAINSSNYPVISASGRFVAFVHYNSTLTDSSTGIPSIFVHDRDADADGIFDEPGAISTMLASVSSTNEPNNAAAYGPSISANGRFVGFFSDATNLVNDDGSTFAGFYMHDMQTGETLRISVNTNGVPANGYSANPSISDDGRFVAFDSLASNLGGEDVNGYSDIFVHDRLTGETRLVSIGYDRSPANGDSRLPFISANGQLVVFQSAASNLVPDDTNSREDIFIAYLVWEAPPPPIVTEEPTQEPEDPPQLYYSDEGTNMLSWGRVSWAIVYELQFDDNADFSSPIPSFWTVLNFQATPTLPDGKWYWRVRALGANSVGRWTSTQSFVVDAP